MSLIGHGCFEKCQIRAVDSSGCHHCLDTSEVYPVGAEHRRFLRVASGSDDLSRPALVEAMVQGGPEVWEAGTFCVVVMLAKEEAKRLWEQFAADLQPTSHDDLRPL